MSAYLVFNYSITNPEAYQAYPPAAMSTFAGHEIEVLVADYASEVKEGSLGTVTIVVRFPSKEAALAWYESPEYEAVKHLRTENTESAMVLCDGFVMPG